MTKVFSDYNQVDLDAEYDNRAKVPDASEILLKLSKLSADMRNSVTADLDISFGASVEENLDVFPSLIPGPNPAPIQFFIHGGYWKMMSKDDSSYVAGAFGSQGCVTIVVNYALIPNVGMRELVRQCRAGLAWTYRNAASFGGDPDRIFVSGHSAGGHLVGMLMATDWADFDSHLPSLPGDLIKGGCGISGLYDLEPIRLCYLNEELNLSKADVDENSPVLLRPNGTGSLILFVGGTEGAEFLRQSEDLANAWRKYGIDVEVIIQPQQNHFSIIEQLGAPDTELSEKILDQMRRRTETKN